MSPSAQRDLQAFSGALTTTVPSAGRFGAWAGNFSNTPQQRFSSSVPTEEGCGGGRGDTGEFLLLVAAAASQRKAPKFFLSLPTVAQGCGFQKLFGDHRPKATF